MIGFITADDIGFPGIRKEPLDGPPANPPRVPSRLRQAPIQYGKHVPPQYGKHVPPSIPGTEAQAMAPRLESIGPRRWHPGSRASGPGGCTPAREHRAQAVDGQARGREPEPAPLVTPGVGRQNPLKFEKGTADEVPAKARGPSSRSTVTPTASAPAGRLSSRRNRGLPCGRASRPRRISPRADRAGTSNRRAPRKAPASPPGRYPAR